MKTLLVLLALLVAVPCYAASFTTDDRTWLHVGVGGAAGAAVNVLMYQATENVPRWKRIAIPTLAVAIPAAGKEFIVDAEPDWGDLFYGIGSGFLGACAADYGQEWVGFVYANDGVVMVGVTREW